ncbi:PepSY domain-containing protein [Kushneria aurantia]|uniref:PepSY domain-containing protein n=1 Tax=Kushneria aurantia TaxID=504092 RepID=A0ABV6G055_9GAMM|nr:PepSY domain-containing protein [Kushneria aurantia]
MAVILAGALLTAALGAAPLAADDDRDELRRRVEQGELVSLATIFDWLEQHFEGRILEAELENASPPRYEVEMISPDGQIAEFEFDASDGRLLSAEGVNLRAMQRQPLSSARAAAGEPR